MAWIETGINLIDCGTDGTFEGPYSEWKIYMGHPHVISPEYSTLTRNTSITYGASLASMRVAFGRHAESGVNQNIVGFHSYHHGVDINKYFRIKARVYFPTDSAIATTGTEIFLHSDSLSKVDIIEQKKVILGQGFKTVGQGIVDPIIESSPTWNTWVEIYAIVKTTGPNIGAVAYKLRALDDPQGRVNQDGVVYMDNVELREVYNSNPSFPGSGFNVFSKNPIPLIYSSPSRQQTNFHYLCELWVQNKTGVAFSKVLTQKGYPGSEANYVFDLGRAMMSFLEPEIPSFNQSTIEFAKRAARKFMTVKKEFYGNPAVERLSEKTEVKNAFMGGLSFIDWPNHDFFTTHKSKFLTWQLPHKKVSRTQQEFLAYAMYSALELYLFVKVYFEDGTTYDMQPLSKTGVSHDICIIPVGFTQLNIQSANPSKKVKKYTVWVSSTTAGAPISEERTYSIDYEFYRHERYFIYQNSFGFMDSVRFTGKFESGISIEKQEADVALPVIYDPVLNTEFSEYNSRFVKTFKANSGHLSTKEKELMIEFLISENRYEVVNGRFIKIQLSSNKAKLIKDVQYMNSLEIDYTYAHSNVAFSNL